MQIITIIKCMVCNTLHSFRNCNLSHRSARKSCPAYFFSLFRNSDFRKRIFIINNLIAVPAEIIFRSITVNSLEEIYCIGHIIIQSADSNRKFVAVGVILYSCGTENNTARLSIIIIIDIEISVRALIGKVPYFSVFLAYQGYFHIIGSIFPIRIAPDIVFHKIFHWHISGRPFDSCDICIFIIRIIMHINCLII